MNNKIDQKIKNILKELHSAHGRSEQFYGKNLEPGESIKFVDIYDMGLAFDSEERLLVDLELAHSEKYPNIYTNDVVEFFKKEKKRLTHRIRAWQNRQLPSQYRENS